MVRNNNAYLGLDGYQRKKEEVHGAGVSDAELRHMEGQRYIVGLIESRIRHAHRAKNDE